MKGIIIGFGNIGQVHYEKYLDLNVDIQAVVETDKTKINLLHSKGLDTYKDLSKFKSIDEIDFIDICSPTYLHYKHLIKSMKYNKAIFVEKPVVRTKEEVNYLRNLSYQSPIFVGEVEQYNPRLISFLKYQDSPKLIEMFRKVNLDFFLKNNKLWFLDERLSGGIVLDLMIHDINLLILKYGKPVVNDVKAFSRKYNTIDEVIAELLFKNFEAKLYSTWDSALKTPIISQIKIHENNNILSFYCDNYLKNKTLKEDPFYLELKSFIKSVKEDKAHYELDIYLDGVEVALEIIKKIKKSK